MEGDSLGDWVKVKIGGHCSNGNRVSRSFQGEMKELSLDILSLMCLCEN